MISYHTVNDKFLMDESLINETTHLQHTSDTIKMHDFKKEKVSYILATQTLIVLVSNNLQAAEISDS